MTPHDVSNPVDNLQHLCLELGDIGEMMGTCLAMEKNAQKLRSIPESIVLTMVNMILLDSALTMSF